MSGLPKEALDEYIGETREMCERISLNLGLVEKNEFTDETLNSIYRDMHSIKGSSHLFGFKFIGDLAHVMETALDPIRHHIITVGPEIMDALYAGLDEIGKMMQSIVTSGTEGPSSEMVLANLIPRIADLTIRALKGEVVSPRDAVGIAETKVDLQGAQHPEIKAVLAATKNTISKPVQPLKEFVPTTSSESKIKELPSVAPQPSAPIKVNLPEHQEQKATPVLTKPQKGALMEDVTDKPAGKDFAAAREDHANDSTTIRIQVGLLDNLMNLVGEMVLIRNQVLQFTSRETDPDFLKLSQRLNVVTSELQNDVMKTRMQPVGTILTKFHRVVRDMSRDLGKKIELRLEGAETELDKTLIEAVKDPLTHLVRNCIDHGIELPEDRKKSKKRDTGSLVIRSYHEGGQVIIEIVDDGRGLDGKKIGKKAMEKGLITEDQFTRMSERELQALIYLPGFSTAEKVSNISGRGVGMDVVKTNIERIGGNIELASTAGSGTTVRLKIPLTLAIIPALVVGAGSARFAIPQVKVVELVRLEQGKSQQNRIELLQGRPVYRLRGQILPLIELASVLKIREDEPEKITSQEIANIVVLNSECGMFGLIVDQIVDSADIVVKPLSEVLKKLSVYAGATIMGDGTVVLILDVLGLSTTASLLAVRDEANARKNLNEEKKVQSADAAEYLLVEVGAPSRYAIPLCLVNRLEEFDESQVEMTGDQRVVRYRDGLLPLISVSKFLNLQGVEKARLREPGSKIPIVVMGKSNRIFGLEMEAIKDVVQIDSQIDSDLRDRDGILGSLIRDKEVIVVIDALAIIDKTLRSLAGASKITTAHQFGSVKPRYDVPANSLEESVGMRRKLKILLAEDTPFFRKHIKKALEEGGYSVTAAVNGDEALKCLESSSPEEFALVLSDIEMPVMDGFELAKRVRQNDVFAKIPMVALTTRFRNADIAKGSEAGFNAYLEKFNGDTLINNIDALLGVKQAA